MCIHTPKHTYMYVDIYLHIYTYIYIYIHTYTHMCINPSSTVDARHDLVVLAARDGEQILEEQVDFPPYLLQWAGSGCSLCYLSRSLRAPTKIVTVDVLPRAASRTGTGGVRSTRDTVRWRVLREGDLLFFTHLGSGGGGRGSRRARRQDQVAVHLGVDGLVEVMGCDPRTPTNTSLVTQRSGLFSAPQWLPLRPLSDASSDAKSVNSVGGAVTSARASSSEHKGKEYVLLVEEVMPSTAEPSAGGRERERQSATNKNNVLVRESVTYVERGSDLDALARGLSLEGQAARRAQEESNQQGEGGGVDDTEEEAEELDEDSKRVQREDKEMLLPPAVEEMNQNIVSEDPFWSGKWWLPSSSSSRSSRAPGGGKR